MCGLKSVFFPIDSALRIIVFLYMGRNTKNIEEKRQTDRGKTLMSKQKEERRIRGKSDNNNKHLWF